MNVRRLRGKTLTFQRFWECCRPGEKLTLVVSVLVLLFCAGREYSVHGEHRVSPPVFSEPPGQNISAKRDANVLLVHVSGAVKSSGIQRLPMGARVHDAVQAAGGILSNADTHTLNLAAKLKDGQKIDVPRVDTALEAAAANTSTTGTHHTDSAPKGAQSRDTSDKLSTSINVNTASAAELEALPGIGPATAARIVEARSRGRFESLNDLDRIKGIGPKKLETLKPYVSF